MTPETQSLGCGPCLALAMRDRTLYAIADGPLGSDDAAQLVAVWHDIGAHVRRLVLDLSALDDLGAWLAATRLAAQLGDRRPLPPRCVVVVALPRGDAGALVLGAVTMSGRSDVAIHADREALRATLDADERATFDGLGSALRARAWHARLRALLARELDLDAAGAAARMAVSARTLQRRLCDAGTSFRAERARMRLERALELIVGSHDKVAAVASAVGFASESQFCRSFQRYHGLAPTAVRLAV